MTRHLILMPVVLVPLISLTLLCGSYQAAARGCIKGAAVGAVAGHVAGHHAVLGAVAGCAVGHHLAKKQQQEQRRLHQEQLQPPSLPRPGPTAADSGTEI